MTGWRVLLLMSHWAGSAARNPRLEPRATALRLMTALRARRGVSVTARSEKSTTKAQQGDPPQSRCPVRADVPGRPWSTLAVQRARRRRSVRTRRAGCCLSRLVQGIPSKARCCPTPPPPPQWSACGSTARPACSAALRSGGATAWCGWPCRACSGGRLQRARRAPPPASPALPAHPAGSRRATVQLAPRGLAQPAPAGQAQACPAPAF